MKSIGKFVITSAILLPMLFISCAKTTPEVDIISVKETVQVSAEIMPDSESKTYFDSESVTVLWKAKDCIGVVAFRESENDQYDFSDNYFQHFSIINIDVTQKLVKKAVFEGQLSVSGWDSYYITGFYPYNAFKTTDNPCSIPGILNTVQYPGKDSWDGQCDCMISNIINKDVDNESVSESFSFYRLFGFLELTINDNILSEYGDEEIESITIQNLSSSDSPEQFMTGSFVNLYDSNCYSNTVFEQGNKYVELNYLGKGYSLKEITPYFVIKAGSYEHVRITIKTASHTLSFDRDDLVISKSRITRASLKKRQDDQIEAKQSLFPKNPDHLNILVYGHSYVVYTMQYMDELLQEAGINNVSIGYFYMGDASLDTYINGCGKMCFYYIDHGQSAVELYKSNAEVIQEYDWDVVVFQTSLSHHGINEMVEPKMRIGVQNVKKWFNQVSKPVPLVGWHMFWSHAKNCTRFSFDPYDRDQLQEYYASVDVAKRLMDEHLVDFIIPTATSIQSMRGTRLNNDSDYTFDTYHCDYGGGCYLSVCTWFEEIISPCFGISVYGNEFVPNGNSTVYGVSDYISRTGIVVTKRNRFVFQEAAIEAVKNPFELSVITIPDDVFVSKKCFDGYVNSMEQDEVSQWN